MMQIVKVHSAKSAKHLGSRFIVLVESGQQSHSPTVKKACDRLRDHAKSDIHIQASEAALSTQGGSVDIVQQLQKVGMQERMSNRAAVKSLIRCTHFLAHQHIAHTTNFSKLVDLVVSCDGEDLKYFMEKTRKNATYTSHIAIVEFVKALETWVEEALLKRLQQASYYSRMADECTDISTVEVMSVFCHWEENGIREEHFLEIIHLRQANTESIYSALVECLKEKKLQTKLSEWVLTERVYSQEKELESRLE